MQVVQVYFSNTTRHTRAVLSLGSPTDQISLKLNPRVAPKVTAEGRGGSNTLGPLLPIFGKQTLEVDNLDLANTALKSPHHCQLLTHASENKNATLDEMGVGVGPCDEMRPAEVILLLYFT